ncbi:MAG: toluene monooxygenase system ferredoxin subunit [Parasphingorhabdus sp.]|jgi:toluene monooxygenase system ferredoxin subunit
MSWKTVCAIGDVPDSSLKQFNVDGVSVLVANIENEFRCFPPECPHMEERLSDTGICNKGVLTCTTHLWQWNLLTGAGVAPAENKRQMLSYDAKTENGQVMAFIEEELEYDFDDEDEDD